jgi:hypothetical protein
MSATVPDVVAVKKWCSNYSGKNRSPGNTATSCREYFNANGSYVIIPA